MPTGGLRNSNKRIANKKKQKDLEADRKAKIEMQDCFKACEPPQPNFTAEDKFDEMIKELNKLDERLFLT